jgi:hypothetical protein
MAAPNRTVQVGDVEDWIIENRTRGTILVKARNGRKTTD